MNRKSIASSPKDASSSGGIMTPAFGFPVHGSIISQNDLEGTGVLHTRTSAGSDNSPTRIYLNASNERLE